VSLSPGKHIAKIWHGDNQPGFDMGLGMCVDFS